MNEYLNKMPDKRKRELLAVSLLVIVFIILLFTVILKKSSSPSCQNVCGDKGGCMLSNSTCSENLNITKTICTSQGHTWCPPVSKPVQEKRYSCDETTNQCKENVNGQYESLYECENSGSQCVPKFVQCPSFDTTTCSIIDSTLTIKKFIPPTTTTTSDEELYITKNCTLGSKESAGTFSFVNTKTQCDKNCTYFISVGDNRYLGAYAPLDPTTNKDDPLPVWIQSIQTKQSNPDNSTTSDDDIHEYLSTLYNYQWVVIAYISQPSYVVIQNYYSKLALTIDTNNNLITKTCNIENPSISSRFIINKTS